MFDMQEYEKKKKLVATKKEQISRAEGKRDTIIERLQKEFDVTIDEAPEKLNKLIAKKDKLEKQLDAVEKELDEYEW